MKKSVLFVLLVEIGLLTGTYLYRMQRATDSVVAPSTPLQQKDTAATKSDLIVVTSPKPYDVVSSPLVVKGRARGTWFFEGSFPITLHYDDAGQKAESYATAKGEWMTTDFVEFEGTIEFPTPMFYDGILVLSKDNPSDIRELDDELRIPVKFE